LLLAALLELEVQIPFLDLFIVKAEGEVVAITTMYFANRTACLSPPGLVGPVAVLVVEA
jgi:hypothetical protein